MSCYLENSGRLETRNISHIESTRNGVDDTRGNDKENTAPLSVGVKPHGKHESGVNEFISLIPGLVIFDLLTPPVKAAEADEMEERRGEKREE